MKVLYDYQAFIQRIGGVSRYVIELLMNLPSDVSYIFPNCFSDNVYLKESGIKHHSIWTDNYCKTKENIYKALNVIQSLCSLKTLTFDIFHPTFYNPYYLGYTGNHPTVITIHDLNFFTYPKMFSDSENVQKKMIAICKQADAIICVSEETKQNLLTYINVSEKKCHVIHHGISQTLINSQSPRIHSKPYILYIGGRDGYKNFQTFLQAFSMMKTKVDLICTGLPFKEYEVSLIKNLGINGRVYQKFVTDEEKDNLLCNAEFFVYPSLAEGFGLPILEAARCGCPCIVSDLKCFREVAGNTAIYFNPKSVDDIVKVLECSISDTENLKHLSVLGRENLKKFTLENNAQKTADVYRSLM